MNLLRAHSLGKSAIIFAILWLAASVGFGETNGAKIQVQVAPYSYYGSVSPNYDGHTLTNKTKGYSMTAKAKSGFKFAGWTFTEGANGTVKNTKITFFVTNDAPLTFTATFTDVKNPSLAITSPANNSVLTNPTSPVILISGTASDNDLVTNVYCWQTDSLGNLIGLTNNAVSANNFNTWWVNALTLTPGTNYVLAYAVDRSGLCSKTNKLKLVYAAAPTALAGGTINTTNQSAPYFISFGSGTNGTFSDGMDVGSYTYKKTGSLTGKLVLRYEAPPSASNNDTVYLRFTEADTNATTGIFSDTDNTDGFTNSFRLTTATNLALSDLTGGATIRLSYADGSEQNILVFLTPPTVLGDGNSNSISLSKPLNLPLDKDYPGNISDRVKVTFNHLKNYSGTWSNKPPVALAGTVATIGTSNSVTILLDKFSYDSNNDSYSVATNTLLTILSYYYNDYADNNFVTNGVGTFVYTNYSRIGSLLQLNRDNLNDYYILTFTNQTTANTTNASETGSFYVETYADNGSFQGTNTGTFLIAAPPLISKQPLAQGTTNGGSVNFAFTATGSQPLTYQWQSSLTGTNGWSDLTDGTTDGGSVIAGSATTNLNISAVTTNDMESYRVIVANSFGSVTSSVVTLSVSLLPIIITQPANVALTNGQTARFNVVATGIPTLTYQWVFNQTNFLTDGNPVWSSSSIISGYDTANLNISSVATGDLGNYQVIISNNFGSVTSRVATLTFSTSVPTP